MEETVVKYPFFQTLKRMLFNVTEKDKNLYFYASFYTIATFLYPFFGIILPKILIDEFTREKGARTEQILLIAGGYFLFAGICKFIKIYLEQITYTRISMLRLNYIKDSANKLFTMDYPNVEDASFFEGHDFAFQATSSNNNGVEMIYHKMFEIMPILFIIGVLMVFIGMLSPFILAGLIISIFTRFYISRRVHTFRYSKKEELSHYTRKKEYYHKITHDFAYGKDIRIYGLKERVLGNYDTEIINYVSVLKKISHKEYRMGFLELLVVLLSDSIIYVILVYQVINGMPISDFSMYLAAILSLSTYFGQAVETISNMINEGQYVYEFYQMIDKNMMDQGGTHKKIEKDTLEIQFEHVSFCYPGTERYIYKDLNFTIHKGEKLAIVGINGAGKSTLIKLVTGLFHPTEGKILVNGIPYEAFSAEEYRSMFSAVFQEVNVLAYTVAENVACTSEQIDRERVWKCLERVGLADKVRGFEKGIDQVLLKVIDENGTDFSGGEKQKLAIARALYKDANMIILDEPTAALDALAEASIYESLNDLIEDKTAIYVSHRLASTKFCDKIALFDTQGLKEYGTHEELMKQQGEYFKMFTIQGKYYQKGDTEDEGESAETKRE